ncbi:MAG: thioredoxin family protein [Chloroflexota bacterium]|jgi:small redox-active disulfide protein 2
MLTIKVLGSGCPNCQKVEENARQALAMLRPAGGYELTHVKDPLSISEYVLKTPGLVINEKVVSQGRIPDPSEIMTWLADAMLAAD